MTELSSQAADEAPPRRLAVVTGMSGAGRTSALKALEDLGYEAVDNLPLYLIDGLTETGRGRQRPMALGIDSRTRGFDGAAVSAALDTLVATAGFDTRLIFVDCDDAVLGRRYTETRRRHPLAVERPLNDGIALERRLLEPLKARADLLLDTTEMKPGDLRRILEGHFALDQSGEMTVFVTSFGFRNGLPREADLVIDVRFLRNPHYDPVLRPMTGLDRPVADYVAADQDYDSFFEKLTGMLSVLLPRYQAEGKSYLTLAIGCTGGRHRSVYTTERLAAWLVDRDFRAQARHRDLTQELQPEPLMQGRPL